MEVAIVENNRMELLHISKLLLRCMEKLGFRDILLSEYSSGESFLNHYRAGEYDLILLDIFMDGISGFDVAREIRSRCDMVSLVIVSSSNNYATESYAVKASYYLHKPLSEADVYRMLNGVEGIHSENKKFLEVSDSHRLPLSDIVYTNKHQNTLSFYLSNGEVVTVRLSHKALSQQLLYNPEFLTIGQGTLVNMMHMEELSREGFLTKTGVLVPVPRRNYNIIKEKYNKFCFERLFCKNMP